MKIAVVATHPIQYHAPWFRALVAEGVDLHVLFSVIPGAAQQATGFGGAFEWDLPLLTGYPWSVLPQGRRATRLGSFFGLRNREIGRVLSALEPDVVLLTGWNALPLLQGLFAAIRLGIPTLVRGESNSLRRRPAWKETGHRALLAFYDGVVSIGRANTAFYERSGVPPERIVEGGYFVENPSGDIFFQQTAASGAGYADAQLAYYIVRYNLGADSFRCQGYGSGFVSP